VAAGVLAAGLEGAEGSAFEVTVGSLFSGVGGFDLAASWLWGPGCVRWQCEIDPFCRRVLERHWPGVVRYEDVRAVDWSRAQAVDIVVGGPPCQPASLAGRRRGAADDLVWMRTRAYTPMTTSDSMR
jgi:site-specific DNA-cytosine methylase